MENNKKPHPTFSEWIEQMRLLCIQNKHSVKIKYNSEQAIALFYIKNKLVDSRKLYRI